MIKAGNTVTVQPISVDLGEIVLHQDEKLLIEEVTRSGITFKRLFDDKSYVVPYHALSFVVV